ncbi:SDR family oxidoreductase, partial [Parabacteroides johnsonii]|uniref:SDR family oxidoreductase n=1 Tax=Parabacteroides johnsonii TaxID=387661 RepID=UPI003568344C
LSANSVMRGRLDARRTLKSLVADLRFKTKIEKNIPLRYIGEPDDLASMALLLCSEAGRYISGADILVDGGMSLPE